MSWRSLKLLVQGIKNYANITHCLNFAFVYLQSCSSRARDP